MINLVIKILSLTATYLKDVIAVLRDIVLIGKGK